MTQAQKNTSLPELSTEQKFTMMRLTLESKLRLANTAIAEHLTGIQIETSIRITNSEAVSISTYTDMVARLAAAVATRDEVKGHLELLAFMKDEIAGTAAG
jgi:hypothetical protein